MFQQLYDVDQQVVEIQAVLAVDDVFVMAEYVGQFLEGQFAAVVVRIVCDLFRGDEPVFGPADLGSDVLFEAGLRGEAGDFHGAAYHGQLIFRVQDGELRVHHGVAQAGAEQAVAEGMEGAGVGSGLAAGYHGGNPLAHFLSGLVGEGNAEDTVAGDVAFGDQVRGAVCDGAGFAGAGAGYNQQGAAFVTDGQLLVGVQAVRQRGLRHCSVNRRHGNLLEGSVIGSGGYAFRGVRLSSGADADGVTAAPYATQKGLGRPPAAWMAVVAVGAPIGDLGVVGAPLSVGALRGCPADGTPSPAGAAGLVKDIQQFAQDEPAGGSGSILQKFVGLRPVSG